MFLLHALLKKLNTYQKFGATFQKIEKKVVQTDSNLRRKIWTKKRWQKRGWISPSVSHVKRWYTINGSPPIKHNICVHWKSVKSHCLVAFVHHLGGSVVFKVSSISLLLCAILEPFEACWERVYFQEDYYQMWDQWESWVRLQHRTLFILSC